MLPLLTTQLVPGPESLKAVSEGRCDIGLSSRALKDEEKSQGLVETTLALDGIANSVTK